MAFKYLEGVLDGTFDLKFGQLKGILRYTNDQLISVDCFQHHFQPS